MEFGWRIVDDQGIKWQICARFHGGNVVLSRKTGNNTGWDDYEPTDEQWDRLLKEAERRLPRRLMSMKEFNRLKEARPK